MDKALSCVVKTRNISALSGLEPNHLLPVLCLQRRFQFIRLSPFLIL